MLKQVFSVRHGVPVDEVTTQEYALQRFTFPQTEFVVEEEPQALEVSISYPESHMEGDLLVADLSANGSFSNLITQTSANANTIVQAPLMFVRGGYVNPGGSLNYAGYEGGYWSSVGRSSSYAYYLDFYSDEVSPSNYGYRCLGFSLRCVALGD